MPRFDFERESRTPHSETFLINADGKDVGRVDVHYTGEVVNATLCLPENFSEDDIQEAISQVDDRIVMSAEPFRDDLVVTVWIGRQAGVYSEEFDEELEDEMEEEIEGDGHRD